MEQHLAEDSFGMAEQSFKRALIDLLEEKDFEKISISDIVKRSGCSRTAFYYHFTDKYDFAEKVANHEIQEFARHISNLMSIHGASYKEHVLSPLALQMADYIYEERRIYTLILDSKYPTMSLDDFISRLNTVLAQMHIADLSLIAEGVDLNLFMYVELYECMIFKKYWVSTGFTLSPMEYTERLAAFLENRTKCIETLLTGF